MKSVYTLFAVGALLCAAASATAQTNVVTDPVGFYKIVAISNSDTFVAIPFTRPPAYMGLVESVSDSNVVVSGSPGWTVNQWVYPADGAASNTYYVLFRSGQKEGAHFTIISNTADTLILDLDVENLNGVTNGTQISIIPYWTLGTVFPNGEGVVPSPSPLNRATEIRIPDFGGVGINLAPSQTYYFHGGYWKKVGGGNVNYNSAVLLRDGYFIMRQNTATNTTLVAQGAVPMNKLRIVLYTRSDGQQDNFIALTRPASMSLNDSGLYESGAFSNSPSALQRTDELKVFDNELPGQNKAPSETYYRLTTGWRKVGGGNTDYGPTNVFVPGKGYLIRKAAVTNSPNFFWVNSANYTNN